MVNSSALLKSAAQLTIPSFVSGHKNIQTLLISSLKHISWNIRGWHDRQCSTAPLQIPYLPFRVGSASVLFSFTGGVVVGVDKSGSPASTRYTSYLSHTLFNRRLASLVSDPLNPFLSPAKWSLRLQKSVAFSSSTSAEPLSHKRAMLLAILSAHMSGLFNCVTLFSPFPPDPEIVQRQMVTLFCSTKIEYVIVHSNRSMFVFPLGDFSCAQPVTGRLWAYRSCRVFHGTLKLGTPQQSTWSPHDQAS